MQCDTQDDVVDRASDGLEADKAVGDSAVDLAGTVANSMHSG